MATLPQDIEGLPQVVLEDANDGSHYTKRLPLAKAWTWYHTGGKIKVSDIEKIKGSPLAYGDRIFRQTETDDFEVDRPCRADIFNAWTPVPLPPPVKTPEEEIKDRLLSAGVLPENLELLSDIIAAKVAEEAK